MDNENQISPLLRFVTSFLNFEFFKVNILASPACRCAASHENAFNFLFGYPCYIKFENVLNMSLHCVL